MLTDPIADMLTRIRNAALARHDRVLIPASKLKRTIADVLKSEGFIEDYEVQGEAVPGTLTIQLRYDRNRDPVITGLKRVSRPGLRRYVNADQVPTIRSGLGIAILSTPRGVMSDSEARAQNVGGEVICQVF